MTKTTSPRPAAIRLVDLGLTWLDQYASDLGQPEPPSREAIERLDGYLSATRLTVLTCRATDMEKSLPRFEAEFSGRLLAEPSDRDRFDTEPDSLTWGLIALEGMAALLESDAWRVRTAALLARGVRWWRPVGGGGKEVGGFQTDSGLTPPGQTWLEALGPAVAAAGGAGVALDLAGLSLATIHQVLDLIEAESQARSIVPVWTLVGAADSTALGRLRSLGGTVVVSPGAGSADDVARSIDWVAEASDPPSLAGIGLATDYLRAPSIPAELAPVDRLIEWVLRRQGEEAGRWLVAESGLRLVRRLTGPPGN